MEPAIHFKIRFRKECRFDSDHPHHLLKVSIEFEAMAGDGVRHRPCVGRALRAKTWNTFAEDAGRVPPVCVARGCSAIKGLARSSLPPFAWRAKCLPCRAATFDGDLRLRKDRGSARTNGRTSPQRSRAVDGRPRSSSPVPVPVTGPMLRPPCRANHPSVARNAASRCKSGLRLWQSRAQPAARSRQCHRQPW